MSELKRPVRSPCVNICALDEQDVCTGCQRSVAEIAAWSRLDDAERLVILQRCTERAQQAGLILG